MKLIRVQLPNLVRLDRTMQTGVCKHLFRIKITGDPSVLAAGAKTHGVVQATAITAASGDQKQLARAHS